MFSSFANTSRLVGRVFARSVTSGAAAAASASSRNFLACVPSNCTGGNDQLWSPSSRAWNIKYFAERTLSSSAAVRAKQPSRIGAAGGSVMVAGRRTGKQLAQKDKTATDTALLASVGDLDGGCVCGFLREKKNQSTDNRSFH